MTVSALAEKLAPTSALVDVAKPVTAYYANVSDPSDPAQSVASGTPGHRGTSFRKDFNERYVLPITQAICLYRQQQNIDGPLFLSIDTHALSRPAYVDALERLCCKSIGALRWRLGRRGQAMSDFKGRHFGGEIVFWAVRWYRRYGISYCDLEQMMAERRVSVDHSTIYRWVQKYVPEIEKRLRWHWRRPRSWSWRVDETYAKVGGKWSYLYRAVDKFGDMIDFHLSPTRNMTAAKRFLAEALRRLKDWGAA